MLITLGYLGGQGRRHHVAPNNSAYFDPLQISNLELWLDAADTNTITEDSGAVSQLDDKSGYGNHAVQTLEFLQPKTGTRTIGSSNTLEFNNSEYMNFVGISSTDFTAFVVAEIDGYGIPSTENNFFSGTNGSFTISVDDATGYPRVLETNISVPLTGIGAFGLADPRIVSAQTGAYGNALWLDGYSQGSNATSTSYTSPTSIMGADAGGADTVNGAIGEILIFTRILSDAEMNQVGNYLSAKWAISWTDI